jgi:hypothetical protein
MEDGRPEARRRRLLLYVIDVAQWFSMVQERIFHGRRNGN